MGDGIFMRVDEVAKVMGVSESFAYKIIRQMNKELKKTGCITISGRIDRKFFMRVFTEQKMRKRSDVNGSI
ncbi:MAG: DNA-binding protein [Clostridia bacterium]|nr:DNA-binding protein [Clostridia bacterium]